MSDAPDNGRKMPDLLIVGAGIAGMTAAVRASELGLDVLVLEKGVGRYPCNSRYTGGAFHLCFHAIQEPPQTLRDAIQKSTAGFADAQLTLSVSSDAATAVDWLRQQGIRTIKVGPDAWRQNFLSPPGLMSPGLHWEGRGGDVMLRTLRARLDALGGHMRCGVRAQRLEIEGARVVGVHIEHESQQELIRAHHVLLSDGGFQANLSLLREFVSPAPEKLKQRGAATGNGDALIMAREAGAALRGMENVYGHLLCRQAMSDDGLWPYPILDYVSMAGIVVDPSGQRFMDEGRGGVYMTNQIARLADPLSATVIFDQGIWKGPATEFILPSNPHLPLAGGHILIGQTLDELAAKAGISGAGLAQTVSNYNAAVDAGHPDALTPKRSAQTAKPWPIRQGPFYAVPLAAGVTYTMGGIATDGNGRVLRESGGYIEGLYASGCATGGLEGGEFSGYVGGLTKSLVMSRRVAADIAAAAEPKASHTSSSHAIRHNTEHS